MAETHVVSALHKKQRSRQWRAALAHLEATIGQPGLPAKKALPRIRPEIAKALLKDELKRRNVGYWALAEKLTAMGIPETEWNIANKIS